MENVNTSTKVVHNFENNNRILVAEKNGTTWNITYGNTDLSRIYVKSANGVMIPKTVNAKKDVTALIKALTY